MRNFRVGIIMFLVMILCFWFQFNVLNDIPLFGVIGNIGIAFVVSLGILTGQEVGIIVGISYGLFTDILIGKCIGIYTVLFFLVGFFCGKISKGFSKENKSSIIIIVMATTLIYEVLSYILFMFIYSYDFILIKLVTTCVLESVYNMLIASILFKPFSFLAEIVNKGKNSYYLL